MKYEMGIFAELSEFFSSGDISFFLSDSIRVCEFHFGDRVRSLFIPVKVNLDSLPCIKGCAPFFNNKKEGRKCFLAFYIRSYF